ncbi:hypothetical protein PUN28_000653 [Cardiocondyla obscurior]|uniref:Uncharacterized protein n=1 Tax=Cardiocondyla obscurior TaxID=286306 RepID=A0AAW2H0F6_9HYME
MTQALWSTRICIAYRDAEGCIGVATDRNCSWHVRPSRPIWPPSWSWYMIYAPLSLSSADRGYLLVGPEREKSLPSLGTAATIFAIRPNKTSPEYDDDVAETVFERGELYRIRTNH